MTQVWLIALCALYFAYRFISILRSDEVAGQLGGTAKRGDAGYVIRLGIIGMFFLISVAGAIYWYWRKTQ